jgi:hypothetical protein
MKYRTHAQSHSSKITAENDDWQQKKKKQILAVFQPQ